MKGETLASTTGRDTMARRVTSNGRAVTFLATDLLPGRPLRLWGALAETSNGVAFIRLGLLGANDGWPVAQLLAVAQARFTTELARTGEPKVETIVRCLERAAAAYREPLTGRCKTSWG